MKSLNEFMNETHINEMDERRGVFTLNFTEFHLCDTLREIANEIENSEEEELLQGKDWKITYKQ